MSEHEPEILKASTPGAHEIEVGMEVMSIDGKRLGHVKHVGATDFHLERPMQRDLMVPFESVVATPNRYEQYSSGPQQPREVVLSVTAAQVDDQHWPHA